MKIPIASPTFGEAEIEEAIDSLRSMRLTMGEKVRRFEDLMCFYLGVNNAVMVNSGSTANLLMMSVAANPLCGYELKPGDEVIVPALTWSTNIWPVIQMGLTPVLVDCDRDTLCIDPEKIEVTSKTRAIFPAHILGNSCDMDALEDIALKNDIFIFEDACESLGTEYKTIKVGTMGSMGSYSFFFSHHITTIEGGMVVTNDDETADHLRCMRAHGWSRDMKDRSIEKEYDIDPRYLFCNLGYSVRPTEIQGAFGIHQIEKLDEMNERRRLTSLKVRQRLAHLPVRFPRPTNGAEHTWFGIPLFCEDRRDLCRFLEIRGIETRPVIAGNIARHPAMQTFMYKAGDLSVADEVMDTGLYINSLLTDEQIEYLGVVLEEYFT